MLKDRSVATPPIRRGWPGRWRKALPRLLAAVVMTFATSAAAQSSTPVPARNSAPTIELPSGISLPSGAVAQPGQIADQTSLRLITAVEGAGDLAAIPAGLEITLAPGWKTYWRSPGDAGYPVTIDWSGSTNLAGARLAWPAPERFTLFGLDTFGYADQVVLPITVTPERPGEPVGLRAKVGYLVCKEVCIPGEAALALDLPAGPARASSDSQAIDRFAAQVPDEGAGHGLALDSVVAAGTADRPRLEVVARSDFPFEAPDLIVEGPAELRFGRPEVFLSDGGRRVRLDLPVEAGPEAKALSATRLTLTLVDAAPGAAGARRGLEATLTPAPSAGATVGGLASVLALALLGGLILNLMPCVLPVLSLKLLGVVGHGGGERRAVRISFLASAAGVLAAFLVLAAGLAAVKAAGLAVGWGIQFQQPLFLAVMLLVLTLFACNLWGWFEIPLPGWLGQVAARGSGTPGQTGLAGHFATGALATLLATPCSAPFLGTAVGFALAGSFIELFAVFIALGLGLALPYLAVAALPGIATMLPRPGRWMLRLRQVLGLALAATAAWLLTVLAAQVQPWVAIVAGCLLVAIAATLGLRRRLPDRRAATAAAMAFAFALVVLVAAPPGAVEPSQRSTAWAEFDEAAIAGLVSEGRVVFVDVTADWCITCQVNKRLVLDDPEIAARLSAPGIVAMQADWTRPDAGIARYLASFGRYGIPFDAVYGPGAPRGIALPELLSKDAVMAAIGQAAGTDGGTEILSSIAD